LKIRSTYRSISAQLTREIISEIYDLKRGRETSLYAESHFERREHPERFGVASQEDPNNNHGNNGSMIMRKYSAARQVAILLAVAQQDSIMHACFSIKDHHGCRLKIRTEDVIFFLTKTTKRQVAFMYQDEYVGRNVLYSDAARQQHQYNASSSSDDEEFYGDY
jgi:hypothetical protein